MIVSYRWLGEMVEFEAGPDRLAADLTQCGLVAEVIESGSSDALLELELTTNRPDCLSHRGVAREIATLYRKTLRSRQVEFSESQPSTSSQASIEIQSPQLCRRYSARLIRGVRVGPSPDWLCHRLDSLGIRPINNIVDATNFVLMESGHPTHAFDLARIHAARILVRRARKGERLATLDGVERHLTEGMLLIADPVKPLALAGIMGGGDSEIGPSTRDVLVESAWFDPVSVRKTSKALGIHTEASHRFERGADLEATLAAANRAAQLIQELAGGEILQGPLDNFPVPLRRPRVLLRRSRLARLLALEIDGHEVERILNSLQFRVLDNGAEGWTVALPTSRMDVEREIDLIEEIARHHGYGNLPTTLPAWQGGAQRRQDYRVEKVVTDRLLHLGYSQTLTYPLVDAREDRKFSLTPAISVLNPVSSETGVMRTSLLPGLLASLAWNYNRGVRSLKIHEVGKVYGWFRPQEAGETSRVGLLLTGNLEEKTVHGAAVAYSLFDLKGDIETLLEPSTLEEQAVRFEGCERVDSHWSPGAAGQIRLGDVELGCFGQLNPDICAAHKIGQPVFAAEIDLSRLHPLWRSEPKARQIPRFPSIQRDLSIVVDSDIAYGDIESAIWDTQIEELLRIVPFDLYQGGRLSAGKKGISIRLVYQRLDRTLVEEDANRFDQVVLSRLQDRFGAQLRR